MTPPIESAALLLVVDDTEANRYAKARVLRAAGFQVIEAATGEAGLRLIAEKKPRLVLLDVNLPDVNGWDVCRRIKRDPTTDSVLVLQMSATFVTEEDRVRSLEGGADACLTEPIEPPVLVATVRALLRARRAEDALREVLERERGLRSAAEAANRAKDEFLATLSHELRSPLGAILTWASLLRMGKLDAERTARAVDAIERNTALQVRMVDDLLDVSRIVSGKMQLQLTLVDLAMVVERTLESIRPAALIKNIAIETYLDPDLGPVSGDPARLQQVVWNLLSNALKFTPKSGKVSIRVEGKASQALITVSDDGKGIDPAVLPRVFERFLQADSSPTRSEGGLGLGLAIVRHFVELHGGTVEAHSPGAGLGSTFVVKLPVPAIGLGSGRGPHHELRAKLQKETLPALGPLRALVVDDEVDAREAISIVLEQCGATVTAVGSVAEALASFEKSVPDIVVSDIAMPHEDGYVLITKLRAIPQDRGGRVPALALTAYAGSIDEKRILASGFQAYLAKPMSATALGAAVASLVRPE